MVAVTEDGSPRVPLTFALWEPPLMYTRGDVRSRRAATGEAADLLAALVRSEVPALAFIRSRRGAETVALTARTALGRDQGDVVAAYRSGYLADDRRDLEAGLRNGRITGMAATTALELGVNIPALDAVLIAGWPGTWSSLWQQAGRAGRAGRPATAVFIARDDPLDTYLIHHPDTLLHHPLEPAVLDPANPYVLAPHLAAAAAELPLTEPDLELFGPAAAAAVTGLTEAGELRRRQSGWHSARRDYPARRISLRGGPGRPVRVVEEETGRLVGTMDEPSAHRFVHDGAVYLHQGESYLVGKLDLDDRVALVECRDPGYSTQARDVTDIDVIAGHRRARWGEADVVFGEVRVTRQVVGYTRVRSESKRREAEVALELPERTLITAAVWWTIPNDLVVPLAGNRLGGAAHAAEHASIGMLPLFATCDRWDVGGLSTEWHPATGQLTVFVYDGHEGGAGFAERAFAVAPAWLRGHQRSHRILSLRNGLPLLHPIPQMRQRQQPPLKGGRSNPPRHSPDESGLTTRKPRGVMLHVQPAEAGGCGGVPHDRGAPGVSPRADTAAHGEGWPKASEQGKGAAPAGGESGGRARSGPGGVSRHRSIRKLIRKRDSAQPPDGNQEPVQPNYNIYALIVNRRSVLMFGRNEYFLHGGRGASGGSGVTAASTG